MRALAARASLVIGSGVGRPSGGGGGGAMGRAAIGPVAGADRIVAKPEGLIVAPWGTGNEAGAILLAGADTCSPVTQPPSERAARMNGETALRQLPDRFMIRLKLLWLLESNARSPG
ncbi:hypothetical protein AV944_18140 (plasmid) [Sphingomonas sp. LK11]|nr:hypothetical protein AV944_18140 [Sphingomonas sp. LK11]